MLTFGRLHEDLAGILVITELYEALHPVEDTRQNSFGNSRPDLSGKDFVKQDLKNAADKRIGL